MERLVGKKAPPFAMEALASDGETFVPISLADYAGKWLVFFFYPLDFTFVCPTELTAFSDKRAEFQAMGAEILSVSTDSVYTHLAWQKNGLGQLGYPMAADQTLEVSRQYGVLLEDKGIALRGLFLIDPEQNVRFATIHDNSVGRNPEEVLRVLAALQSGGLCGAGWTAGTPTLDVGAKAEAPPQVATGTTARVYSLPDCSYCRTVKKFLKDSGVPYQDINLAEDKAGQAFMKERKYTRLPVTVIGDNEILGPDMPAIKAALGMA